MFLNGVLISVPSSLSIIMDTDVSSAPEIPPLHMPRHSPVNSLHCTNQEAIISLSSHIPVITTKNFLSL